MGFRGLNLAYTNQSVNTVQGNNRCLFSDPYKTHKNKFECESLVISKNNQLVLRDKINPAGEGDVSRKAIIEMVVLC